MGGVRVQENKGGQISNMSPSCAAHGLLYLRGQSICRHVLDTTTKGWPVFSCAARPAASACSVRIDWLTFTLPRILQVVPHPCDVTGDAAPCKNGGVCNRLQGQAYTCGCVNGWNGFSCEVGHTPTLK